ncbi:Uncharacterised protein [Pannonibacter phragmitetus]|uniref:Uncharacterized protein n=1 Tax=Pannonibacter phragmitetus TaxID=121719 RepID=A0A378ZQJ6_9HYPH|nr:hypothetical protein [Pannonibacter phragmitetus]SUA99532.1 Uncharacterised protein [Pannonibacter phragmitetus]
MTPLGAVPPVKPQGSAGSVNSPRQTADAATAEAGGGLGFRDIVDIINIINPLQHLPVIGEVYRNVTGDGISDGARHAGHALYGLALGGPLGMAGMLGYAMAGSAVSNALQAPDAAQDADAAVVPVPDEPVISSVKPQTPELANDNASASSKAIGTDDLLGMRVARSRDEAAAASANLTRFLTDPASVSMPLSKPSSGSGTPEARPQDQPPALDAVIQHPANRLPLDVLETLRNRHKDLTRDARA